MAEGKVSVEPGGSKVTKNPSGGVSPACDRAFTPTSKPQTSRQVPTALKICFRFGNRLAIVAVAKVLPIILSLNETVFCAET